MLDTFEFHLYFLRNNLRSETFEQFGLKTQLSNEMWAGALRGAQLWKASKPSGHIRTTGLPASSGGSCIHCIHCDRLEHKLPRPGNAKWRDFAGRGSLCARRGRNSSCRTHRWKTRCSRSSASFAARDSSAALLPGARRQFLPGARRRGQCNSRCRPNATHMQHPTTTDPPPARSHGAVPGERTAVRQQRQRRQPSRLPAAAQQQRQQRLPRGGSRPGSAPSPQPGGWSARR